MLINNISKHQGPADLNQQGELLYKSGNITEAVRCFNQAVSEYPQDPRAYNNLAVIRFGNGEYGQALEFLSSALQVSYDDDETLENLFLLSENYGDLKSIKEVVQIHFDHTPVGSPYQLKQIELEKRYLDLLLKNAEQHNETFENRDYKISVVVSTYSSEEFMRECLTDLTSQSVGEQIEIIIVDAHSPQNEYEIVREYQNKHSNIRYIRTEQRIPIYTAWNLAIHVAKGEYIIPFSTNDRLCSDGIEKLYTALEQNSSTILVYGDTNLTPEPHQSIGSYIPMPEGIGGFFWPPYQYEMLLSNCLVGPHPLWRKSIHEEIGFFNDHYKAIADQDYWLRIAHDHTLLHISEVIGLQWMSKESLSGTDISNMELFEIHVKHQLYYEKKTGKKLNDQAYEDRYILYKGVILTLIEENRHADALGLFEMYKHLFINKNDFLEFSDLMGRMKGFLNNS